jgi:hypothetical protein
MKVGFEVEGVEAVCAVGTSPGIAQPITQLLYE